METKKIEEQLKSAIYVVVGAATTLAEKTKELVCEFEEKGKATCDKCEINNEELKHNVKEAINKVVSVTVVKEESTDDFVSKMDSLSAEELAKIKEKLASLEKEPAQSEEAK